MTFRKMTHMGLALAALVFGMFSESSADEQAFRMATTTSTDNTGLFDYLAPHFKRDTGFEWQWVAVGTGKALELGKNCDVDVVLVHAPDAEREYVEEGFGVNRRRVMYNDFVIIGPNSDPAGVKGQSTAEALNVISKKKAIFASRGDNSGTHKKELSLWKSAGITVPDKEPWYVQTGQGMLATIIVAAEREGYTLTDRGTYIKYESTTQGNPPLVILVEGDPQLYNQYSVMAVNPIRCPSVNYDLAIQFIDWMTSPRVQKLIGDFELMGKKLFIPNAE
jgi:tungstate transport system substrate-binding protein